MTDLLLTAYLICILSCQVDAMKIGAKEMKKAYKDVKLDQIDVSLCSAKLNLYSSQWGAFIVQQDIQQHVAKTAQRRTGIIRFVFKPVCIIHL